MRAYVTCWAVDYFIFLVKGDLETLWEKKALYAVSDQSIKQEKVNPGHDVLSEVQLGYLGNRWWGQLGLEGAAGLTAQSMPPRNLSWQGLVPHHNPVKIIQRADGPAIPVTEAVRDASSQIFRCPADKWVTIIMVFM